MSEISIKDGSGLPPPLRPLHRERSSARSYLLPLQGAVDLEVTVGRSDLDPLFRLGMASRQTGTIAAVDMKIRGNQEASPEEHSLTGITVPAEWMTQAYPFRVW